MICALPSPACADGWRAPAPACAIPGADQALITDTMADLDDVLRMFSSLTRISQIETTTRTSGFGSVDLVEVSEAVVDLYDAAAEDKDVDLKVVGDRPMVITGDRDLLSTRLPTWSTMRSSTAAKPDRLRWNSAGPTPTP